VYIRLKKKDFMTGKESVVRVFSSDSIIAERNKDGKPQAPQYRFNFEIDEDPDMPAGQ